MCWEDARTNPVPGQGQEVLLALSFTPKSNISALEDTAVLSQKLCVVDKKYLYKVGSLFKIFIVLPLSIKCL